MLFVILIDCDVDAFPFRRSGWIERDQHVCEFCAVGMNSECSLVWLFICKQHVDWKLHRTIKQLQSGRTCIYNLTVEWKTNTINPICWNCLGYAKQTRLEAHWIAKQHWLNMFNKLLICNNTCLCGSKDCLQCLFIVRCWHDFLMTKNLK